MGFKNVYMLAILDAKRDWGYAKDYVEAMWLMLQQDVPEDFVIATGKTHSVREFIEKAFAHVDINLIWQGTGIDECGIDTKTKKSLVRIDEHYFRPTEVDLLIGDSRKAQRTLGWYPKMDFDGLVTLMVDHDCKLVKPPQENQENLFQQPRGTSPYSVDSL